MPVRQNSKLIISALGSWLLIACALLNSIQQAPTQVPAEAHTQAAQTIMVQASQAASTESPLPSPTSPLGTFTPTPTSIPAITTTPVSSGPQPPAETIETTDTPEPTQAQSPPPSPGDFTVVFQDEFSIGSGWYENQGDDFGFEYAQGGYRIYVNIRSAPIWSIRQRHYTDVPLQSGGTQLLRPGHQYRRHLRHRQIGKQPI